MYRAFVIARAGVGFESFVDSGQGDPVVAQFRH